MEIQNVNQIGWSDWLKKVDKRLIRNISYIGISNIMYAASQWGVIIIVTKLSNIRSVAQLSIGLAVVTPIMLFFGAGLRTFISIDVEKKYNIGDYLVIRSFTSLAGFLIILIFGLISKYSNDTFIVIVLIALVKIVEGFEEVCWGINQRVDMMDPVGISRLLRSITCILAIGLGVAVSGDLKVGITAWGLLWLLILFFYDLPKAQIVESLNRYQWNSDKSRGIIKQIFPLALIAGLVALNDKATQYQIAGFLGEAAVGYFTPLAYVIQGVGLGVVSIAETMMPRLAISYRSNRKSFVRSSLLLTGIGFLIGASMLVIFSILSNVLLPFLYTRDFLAHRELFIILLATGIFRFAQTGLGTAITAAGQFYQQAPNLGVSLFVLLSTGWYLIPRYGLNGAAYSVGVTTIYLFISFLYLWLISVRREIV